MKIYILLTTCSAVVLWLTWGVSVPFLSYQPIIVALALLVGLILIACGLFRGERFARQCLKNQFPLLVAGVLSLLAVTVLRGSKHGGLLIGMGVGCFCASVAVVASERERRLIAAGLQVIILLYIWGLVPLWGMGVYDDWL